VCSSDLHGGGQGESDEGRDSAAPTGAQQADGKAELTAGRARQELAYRQQLRIACIVQPAPLLDEGPAEIAKVGDGSAERTQAQREEGEENLPRFPGRLARFV
jgi:hypothetical protein